MSSNNSTNTTLEAEERRRVAIVRPVIRPVRPVVYVGPRRPVVVVHSGHRSYSSGGSVGDGTAAAIAITVILVVIIIIAIVICCIMSSRRRQAAVVVDDGYGAAPIFVEPAIIPIGGYGYGGGFYDPGPTVIIDSGPSIIESGYYGGETVMIDDYQTSVSVDVTPALSTALSNLKEKSNPPSRIPSKTNNNNDKTEKKDPTPPK